MLGSLFETKDKGEIARDTEKNLKSILCIMLTLVSEPRGKTRICGLQNQGATSYLNSPLQNLPFSGEFRGKYEFYLFCCAKFQEWICVGGFS